MKRQLFVFLVFIYSATHLSAKEGMWIPTLLQKYNIEEMSKMGFKLSAEDVYSVNHASMKDAVVSFGGGCTGGVISNDGLLITNHHCGYGEIQNHSTVEHDYLTNGFWAMNKSEELPNPTLTVQFLVKMDDVTEKIMTGIADTLKENARANLIMKNTNDVVKEYITGTGYSAQVRPLFNGNQYFIYVYETFRDVRLVGAPPSAIGKFGGDTDNWVWPRHTGDFSLFRIYADKDNKPAKYSPNNVPYHPKKFFPINLKSLKEGDFTMVFGYPGSTQRYIPSQAVNMIANQSDPAKVAIRTAKLDILNSQMNSDAKIRIQYSGKYASTSNSWKKWQGEVKGLQRIDAVKLKKDGEAQFSKWVNNDPSRIKKYGTILSDFEKLYDEYLPYQSVNDYYSECVQRGSDIFGLAYRLEMAEIATTEDQRKTESKRIKDYLADYLKDYDKTTDGKVWSALMQIYLQKVDHRFLPDELVKQLPGIGKIENLTKIYNKSILSDSLKIKKMLDNFGAKSVKELQKDQAYSLYKLISQHYKSKVDGMYKDLLSRIGAVQKKYTAALMEMNEGKVMIADANSTLRVSFGKVEGYKPADGVTFKYFTTIKGMIEKDNPAIYDYNVPEALRKIYRTHDFGPYVNDTGEVPVAFCASNHTTGGNSGSPVVNANGELIGLNFDRGWEGTMSDIVYDPEICRNISLDMHYALFIIDKFAGAGYLLKEMEIVK
ncbi:MAG: S46 family peptidase [Mariniphaga sp.]